MKTRILLIALLGSLLIIPVLAHSGAPQAPTVQVPRIVKSLDLTQPTPTPQAAQAPITPVYHAPIPLPKPLPPMPVYTVPPTPTYKPPVSCETKQVVTQYGIQYQQACSDGTQGQPYSP